MRCRATALTVALRSRLATSYADVADILDRAGDGPALRRARPCDRRRQLWVLIVRSAEVGGRGRRHRANKRAAGMTVGSYKTSAGAVMHLPIAQVPNIARALDDLKAAGFWVGGASPAPKTVAGRPAPFRGAAWRLSMGSGAASRLV